MENITARLTKLVAKVLLFAAILIALGNLIMLVFLRGSGYTMQMFVYSSVNSVLVGGAFLIGLTVMINILDRKLPWLHFPLKRLVVQFLTTILFSLVIIVVTIVLTGLFTHQRISSDFFFDRAFFMAKIAFVFIFVGSLLSNAIMFFKNWKEAAVQQEKLKREQLALQYETLKSQVNPHFLFNNLNSLTSLISTNPDKAIDFVKKLSEVYRYVLDQKDQELVDLETELKFVESYVFLQKIRFEANLEVQIQVNARNFKIIPLSVQMLVENAIKHNEISDRKPLQIKIHTTDDHFLIVENQLQKKAATERSGTGLQNIRERYEFFTGKRVTIFENHDRFLVSIPLLTD
ncbi:MAG: histidine kinase [Prolixibacteraceae bacterium]|nr:histidine kinase [Prolixibacteraceae bacterium]